MADFSPSGIEGFPSMTLESIRGGGDPRVLGWVREAVTEGDRINRSDPAYERMEKAMQYVAGDQNLDSRAPEYTRPMVINESRRAIQGHVSALTDLKPVFAYKSMDPAFQVQADLINKLTIASWITNMQDVELGFCIKYALTAGTGDLVTEWNPYGGFGGDIKISARDPRDTLPWRPATHARSVQDWEGLILRESHSVNTMRGLFPDRANMFRATTDSLLSTLMGRFRQVAARLMSPAADTLSGLNMPAMASRVRSGEVLLYRVYLTDRTRNLTDKPIPMGDPTGGWSYVVQPGGYLYPYKRLIVCTPDFIIYDGPQTYWHGLFPVSRLKLWDLPWHFLGLSLLNDLMPVQDGINQAAGDIRLAIRKWLDPATVYNRGAVSESFMRLFDPRRPGAKVKLTDAGMKEGFKQLEGPAPQAIALAMQFMQWLVQKHGDLSGTPNLQELMMLRQLPGAETIQKYWEAMTPELRQEGRMVEAFLREVAEQMKTLRFQYESNAKRVTILGDAGLTLQDFDFDPEVLVPAMAQQSPGYQPEFDAAKPRDVRAQAIQKKIVFTIAPNSILAMNATEQKLMRLQLARGGMYDFWSLLESLEIPNVGAPPAIPLPPLNPEQTQKQVAQEIAQAQQNGIPPEQIMQALASKFTIDPMSGQILEIRVPQTVTERLIAQRQLGIGMTESPAGRKASGEAPPQMEEKSDGRTTVTESRHDKGPGSR